MVAERVEGLVSDQADESVRVSENRDIVFATSSFAF